MKYQFYSSQMSSTISTQPIMAFYVIATVLIYTMHLLFKRAQIQPYIVPHLNPLAELICCQ